MKRVVRLVGAALFALLVVREGIAEEAARIKWRPWSDSIFEQAQREHRFVLLDLEAVWCHRCHMMDGGDLCRPGGDHAHSFALPRGQSGSGFPLRSGQGHPLVLWAVGWAREATFSPVEENFCEKQFSFAKQTAVHRLAVATLSEPN